MSNEVSIFTDNNAFDTMFRMARVLSGSKIVPKAYQGSQENCFIACNIAHDLKKNPMMVMQNLHIIHDKPAWSSVWYGSAIQESGLYTGALWHETEPLGGKTVNGIDIQDMRRRTVAVCARTGKDITGPWISYETAILEGWWTRSGSKWRTMPDLMLTYRANAFFARTNCPGVLFGILSHEEVEDIPVIELNPKNRSAAPVKNTIDATPPPPKPSPLDLVAEAFRQIRDCGNLQCVTGILTENSKLFAEFQKENPERYTKMWAEIEKIQETFAAAEKGNQ